MNAKSLELQITVAAENAARIVTSLSQDFKDLKKSAGDFVGSSDNVKKTIDTLESSAERTAKSLKLFGASSSELKSEQQKLKNGILDLVQHGMNPESAECKKLIDEYRKLGDESEKLELKENGLFGVFDKLKGELGSVAVAAAAIKFDQMLVGAGANALELAGQFQTAREEFGTLLGDMQAGAALFDDVIKPFNDFTPFDLETTTQATKIFLAAKVPISDLTATLNRMGNIAQGNSQKMISFANAFSKASAKGKADMEVLNVYLDQGVPILDELAKGFNTTTEEIIKMASKGEISFKDFELALERLSAEGGAYFGGLELASKSYASMWAGLHEALNSLAASIGDMFLPAACKILEWLTNVANAINNSPLAKGVLLGALTAITVWLNTKMIFALTGFIIKTVAGTAAQMSFNLALGALNPVVLVATLAIAGLVTAYVMQAQKAKDAEKATNAQSLAMKEQEQATRSADQALQDYINTVREMSDEELSKNLSTIWADFNVEGTRRRITEIEARLKNDPTLNSPANSAMRQNLENELSSKKKQLEAWEIQRAEAQKELPKRKQDAAVAASDDLLKWRDQKYSQSLEGQLAAVNAEIAKAKSLLTAKVAERDPVTGEYKETDGYNRAKTEVILRDLEKRKMEILSQMKPEAEKTAEEIKKAVRQVDFNPGWCDKLKDELQQIYDERDRAEAELDEKAFDQLGAFYQMSDKYEAERYALRRYYDNKIADYEKKQHEEEMQRIRDEVQERERKTFQTFTDNAETSRHDLENGNFDGIGGAVQLIGKFGGNTALSNMNGTNIGSLISSFKGAAGGAAGSMAGGMNPIIQFVIELGKAVMSIENVQKSLNYMGTVVEGVMSIIEPIISDMLEPTVEMLHEVGEVIGQILAPALTQLSIVLRVAAAVTRIFAEPVRILGRAFEWLNNKVIVPVGNKIINAMNKLIDALNNIPGFKIKKLKELPLVGEEAEKLAEAAQKAADAARAKIEAMYKAQIDDINDELRYQIQSLQKQYELGLISRQQYIDQKNAYKAAADTEILKIEQKMAVALEHIEDNTYAALDQQQQAAVATQREDARQAGTGTSYAEKWGSVVPVLGHIAGGVADVAVGAWNGLKTAATGIASGIKNLFGFAVGTDNIPYDMPAIVHKGEGIIPKTFNEAIKSGTYSLVGKNSERRRENAEGRRGSTINVSVHVEGSVIKQKDLVAEIYNGLAAMIGSGEAAPLPA